MTETKKRSSPYGAVKFDTIDEYHGAQPEEIRHLLQQMREIILQAAPNAIETISYNMPAFKQHKVFVYYAANKQHIGFYPTPGPIKAFEKELEKYKTSKGAIHFPICEPLPVSLIKKIVRYRLEEDQQNFSSKLPAKKTASKRI